MAAARGFVNIATQVGRPILSIIEPICRPPYTPERLQACSDLSKAKTAAERASRLGSFEYKVLSPIASTLGSFLIPGSSLLEGLGSKLLGPQVEKNVLPSPSPVLRGGTMSFADGINSGDAFSFDSLFGGINQALQGGLGQSLLGLGTQVATNYFDQSGIFTNAAAVPGGVRAVVGGAVARTGSVVGRGFFNRFPNLAAGIQAWRNQGKNVTRAKLYSLMKRFGPDFLVTGGILTAAAVSELAMAGAGRRRMNPGNIKALRRAHRRMKSFHHVCATNDTLLTHRRRRTTGSASGGVTRITQVK